jgi:hypothetical protein
MAAERKRPFYLVLALLGALALGIHGAYWGWSRTALYYATINPALAGEGIADDHARAAAIARVETALHALDVAKPRAWPLGVASLLLGAATLLFAMRALAGSRSARVALVQLVIAQAGVHVASHYVLRDVSEAEFTLQAQEMADERAAGGPSGELPPITTGMLRAAETVRMILRTLGSALVVIGLTRRKSREFFGDSGSPVEEQ